MSIAIEKTSENDVLKGCTIATNDKGSTFYIKDGKVIAECRKSKQHGLDIERWYNADGKLHRDGDLPAVIWYENGQKTRECWYRDDKRHRDGDLPAEIWCENGQKTGEWWYRDDKYHRDGDLPAVIHYKNSQKIEEYWYRDGKLHRDGDLPAVIRYKNGQKTEEYWYRDDREIAPLKPADNAALIAEIENDLANIAAKLATLKTGVKK